MEADSKRGTEAATGDEVRDEKSTRAQDQPYDLPVVDTDDHNLTERQRMLVLASLDSDKARLRGWTSTRGPDLTVIAGRNGSGKSSFAEALEYALTGENYRWKGKAPFWKDSWRNLHQVQNTRVRVELAEESVGRTEIGVEWPTDSALNDSRTWTQRHGKPRAPGVGSLGWGRRSNSFALSCRTTNSADGWTVRRLTCTDHSKASSVSIRSRTASRALAMS